MSPRFTLTELLRSDGFVETWRGVDVRGDEPVVVRRTVLTGDPKADDRIGHRYRAEIAAFSRRNLPGFPTILDFGIDGPAWSARLWAEAREDDPERLMADGADALAALHVAGLSHLNLHRGNALRGSLGLDLTDPGAARDWRRDAGLALADPNAAPEQESPEGRRGPWTDVWRLAATARALGHRETDVLRRAMQEDPVHRYPDGGALRAALLGEAKGRTVFALGVLDEQLIRLNRFSYESRACPACGGVLLEPKPLEKGQCPVCREGRIGKRRLDARLCPACHGGILKAYASSDPPATCPRCPEGKLHLKRGKAACNSCGLELTKEGGKWSDGERSFTSDEWRAEAGRTATVLLCDACDVQFDLLPDGRRRRMAVPRDIPEILTEQESARLADFSPLGGGDACCPVCSAEFLLEKEAMTLVSYFDDPFGFGAANSGRRLPYAFEARVAVGLGDPKVKTVCDICNLAMSAPKDGLVELRSTQHPALRPVLGESRSLEDWHRFAQGLPPEAEEGAFARTVETAMRRAYLSGELGFDFTTSVLWRGPAIRDGRRVMLTVTDWGLEMRRGIRRTRLPLESFWASRASGDRLVLLRTGGAHIELEVASRELPVDLQSGRRTVSLGAKDLAARIGRELAKESKVEESPV